MNQPLNDELVNADGMLVKGRRSTGLHSDEHDQEIKQMLWSCPNCCCHIGVQGGLHFVPQKKTIWSKEKPDAE